MLLLIPSLFRAYPQVSEAKLHLQNGKVYERDCASRISFPVSIMWYCVRTRGWLSLVDRVSDCHTEKVGSFPGLFPSAWHFIMLASSVNRDVNSGGVGRKRHRYRQ